MIEKIIFSSILGYLLGSIPTAYIILKLRRGIDIRKEGSGNVGTLNSFEVSNSKKIGLFVLIIDMLKGLLSVIITKYLFGIEFLLPMTSLVFAVLGHCYSIWLKFKGGRGIATVAGGTLVLAPSIIILWMLAWGIVYKIWKDIHLANILASSLLVVTAILASPILNNLSIPPSTSNFIFGFYLSLLMLIILSKHWEPLKGILRKKKRDNS